MKVTLPTGGEVELVGATAEEAAKHEAYIRARYRFAMQYAKSKGWEADPEKLSIQQILEIRKQPGWQTPEGHEPMELNAHLSSLGGTK